MGKQFFILLIQGRSLVFQKLGLWDSILPIYKRYYDLTKNDVFLMFLANIFVEIKQYDEANNYISKGIQAVEKEFGGE